MRAEKLKELENIIEEMKVIRELKGSTSYPRFLSNETRFYELEHGIIRREKILKNGKDGSAAIVLPFIDKENVLLVVQPRVFTKRTVGVELPAGYIEESETGKEAALRELKEETGYVPNELISLGALYQDEGCSAALNEFFIAFNCESKYNQNLDKDEYIKYFICTYKEAIELMDMGYINGANSVIALERSKKYVKE